MKQMGGQTLRQASARATDLEVADGWSTIQEPLWHYSEQSPDRVFLKTPDRQWSYGALRNEVERIAGGLHELGVAKGDHVALTLENGYHFLATWFAVNLLGAVQVPINIDLVGESLRYVLHQSRASILVAEGRSLERVTTLGSAIPEDLRVIVRRGDGVDVPGKSHHEWGALAGKAPPVDVHGSDRAAIIYTSGTTGRSKGVMLSHAYFLHMARENVAAVRLGSDDTYYTCLPLFHAMAQLSGTMGPLVAGARIALVRRFSASGFFEDCRRFEATGFGAIAAMTSMLYNLPVTDKDRVHNIRFGFSIAVPPTIKDAFETRFGLRLIDGYGLTEGGQVTYSPYDSPRHGSCGKPAGPYEVEIQDQDGNPVPTGQPGEIAIRTRKPGVCMDGYYDQPEATVAAFRNLWLHTGDLGMLDEDGYLYFIDRAKDAIRRRGENISSQEVEALVHMYEEVTEVAAYPVPSELGEDDVMLAVVFREGADASWDSFLRHCRNELPRFALPRYVRRMEALPRTPTQKIEKHRLRSEGITDDTIEVTTLQTANNLT